MQLQMFPSMRSSCHATELAIEWFDSMEETISSSPLPQTQEPLRGDRFQLNSAFLHLNS